MSDTEKKWKEFWLSFGTAYGDTFGDQKVNEDDIHVIEHAAYEELKAENEQSKEYISMQAGRYRVEREALAKQYVDVAKERDELKAERDKSVQELTDIRAENERLKAECERLKESLDGSYYGQKQAIALAEKANANFAAERAKAQELETEVQSLKTQLACVLVNNGKHSYAAQVAQEQCAEFREALEITLRRINPLAVDGPDIEIKNHMKLMQAGIRLVLEKWTDK